MPESDRFVLESGSFGRNLANLDFDETVRIPAIVAWMAESGKSVQNLSVSDGISSSVIFILFYINIYMFGIKINFYRLIWLNKNIKKNCDFL